MVHPDGRKEIKANHVKIGKFGISVPERLLQKMTRPSRHEPQRARGGRGRRDCDHRARVPVRPEVAGACEILGFDPLHIADEGKLLAIVPGEASDAALVALRAHPLGADAATVGEVTDEHPGMVVLRTVVGGSRVLDMLVGDPLPRIC